MMDCIRKLDCDRRLDCDIQDETDRPIIKSKSKLNSCVTDISARRLESSTRKDYGRRQETNRGVEREDLSGKSPEQL